MTSSETIHSASLGRVASVLPLAALVVATGCGIPIRTIDPFAAEHESRNESPLGRPTVSIEVTRHGDLPIGDDTSCAEEFRSFGLRPIDLAREPEPTLRVSIESTVSNSFTTLMWLSVLSGGLIPLPSMETQQALTLTVSSPFPSLSRTIEYNDEHIHWVGWVFVPVAPFLQDPATVSRACEKLAHDVSGIYTEYHEDTWHLVRTSGSKKHADTFLAMYPDSPYATQAREIIRRRLLVEMTTEQSRELEVYAELVDRFPDDEQVAEIGKQMALDLGLGDRMFSSSRDRLVAIIAEEERQERLSRLHDWWRALENSPSALRAPKPSQSINRNLWSQLRSFSVGSTSEAEFRENFRRGRSVGATEDSNVEYDREGLFRVLDGRSIRQTLILGGRETVISRQAEYVVGFARSSDSVRGAGDEDSFRRDFETACVLLFSNGVLADIRID